LSLCDEKLVSKVAFKFNLYHYVVVLAHHPEEGATSSVEMLSPGEDGEEPAFVNLPPLSCGGIRGTTAIAVDESASAMGTVILLGAVQGMAAALRLNPSLPNS
jgi:hypothetical protein